MKNTIIMFLVFALGTGASAQTPAFPGAEGAGKWAIGGRGGVVYEVTTLEDYIPGQEAVIPGSLREAVEASGPRIVVFRVAGNIELRAKLIIRNSYITIAGQSAPGGGVCIWRYPVVVEADHVIIRFMRFRLTDESAKDPGWQHGEGMDSLSVVKGHNIIVDHCSANWGVDETLSTSVRNAWTSQGNYPGDITVQWCIIAESLNCSVHEDGCHGYGTLAKGGYGNEYTYHHNLYAHHSGRNPYPGNYKDISVDSEGLTFDFCNNVIYNWGGSVAGYNSQANACSVTRMNFIGNYYMPGPNSTGEMAFSAGVWCSRGYFADNWMSGYQPEDEWDIVNYFEEFKLSEPTPVSEPVELDDAVTAYERVLAGVGATLPVRDAMDTRIVNDVINSTGSIIDDENDVGGLDVPQTGTPPVDTDHDGMPDEWEMQWGLNPDNPYDGSGDIDGDGYTNVEEYLNYLVFLITEPDRDFDDDGDVDRDDLFSLTSNWLDNNCDPEPVGSLTYDCDVDIEDFVVFAQKWLEGYIPGVTYYVAVDGDDTNAGTFDSPWATIQKAAETLSAGDEVIVMPGTYYGQVSAAESGLRRAPITYMADSSGDVVLDANGDNHGFYIGAKSWIVIDGFKITGAARDGIRFHDRQASNNTATNCLIYGNASDGIEIYKGIDISIENCLIYNNNDVGIRTVLSANDNLQVSLCTIYGNSKGLKLSGNGGITDCIITDNSTNGIMGSASIIVTYCDVWNNSTDYSGGVSAGVGCISSDPLFVDPPNDFHLGGSSSCIGAGSDGGDIGYRYPPE